MSKEYIEREALLKTFEDLKEKSETLRDKIYLDGVMAVIDTAPASDVAEVVHGEWLENDGRCYCNRCFEFSCTVTDDTGIIHNDLTKFCPNCGAKMDGGKTENK